ncbi:MAG: ferrous iron transport protein A [Planctomycetes bacterium]|nr:ferrous iron transport protein A [Planctomycetota bacterium]
MPLTTADPRHAEPLPVVECGADRLSLDAAPNRCVMRVEAVTGDDALAARLAAVGFWPGAEVERITAAPFGGPLLFRLHGFRFALRRSEAMRVQVVVCRV